MTKINIIWYFTLKNTTSMFGFRFCALNKHITAHISRSPSLNT